MQDSANPTPPVSPVQPQSNPEVGTSEANFQAQAPPQSSQTVNQSQNYTEQYQESPYQEENIGVDPNQAQAAYFPNIARPTAEELVYEWQAPSRPFKERSRKFYTTVIIISILISLILFFAGQFLPIAVIVAVVFLFYVLSTIPPTTVVTQFTTFGIRFEEQLYYWEELGRFWFDEAHGQRMVHLEVARFPNRLTLMIGQADELLIEEMLGEILLQQKPLPTTYEKAAAWLAEKLPLEVDK